MEEEKKRSKDYFWQMQNKTAFCKAKSDWLAFEKVHISFVSHKGKPSYKQLLFIDGAFDLHGDTGILFLSEMILTGKIDIKARQAKEEAAKNNKTYADALFTSPGGTSSKRSNGNGVTYRQISVSPGNTKDYVLTASTCEGYEDAEKKILPMKDATWQSIRVALSKGDLYNFARAIQIEYTAYRTYCLMSDNSWNAYALSLAEAGSGKPANTSSKPAVQTAPEAAVTIDRVIVMYDTKLMVNDGFPVVCTEDIALETLKGIIISLAKSPQKLSADKEQYAEADKLISSSKLGSSVISFVGKENKDETNTMVVTSSPLCSKSLAYAGDKS